MLLYIVFWTFEQRKINMWVGRRPPASFFYCINMNMVSKGVRKRQVASVHNRIVHVGWIGFYNCACNWHGIERTRGIFVWIRVLSLFQKMYSSATHQIPSSGARSWIDRIIRVNWILIPRWAPVYPKVVYRYIENAIGMSNTTTNKGLPSCKSARLNTGKWLNFNGIKCIQSCIHLSTAIPKLPLFLQWYNVDNLKREPH